MPSIKPAIRSKEIGSDGKSNIKIRISHDKKVRYIKTPYYIEPEFLDDKGHVKKTHPKYSSLNHALLKLQLEYEEIIAQIGPEIIFMDITPW